MALLRREQVREWHARWVVLPRKIMVQGAGRRWAFCERLEARYSISHWRWYWRRAETR